MATIKRGYMPAQTIHNIVALRGLLGDAGTLIASALQATAQMMQGVPVRTCAGCGRNFHVAHPRQRYHTDACRVSARNMRRKRARKSRDKEATPDGNTHAEP